MMELGDIVEYDPEHVGCCIAPDFVEYLDGYCTHRLELVESPVAGWVTQDSVPTMSRSVKVPLEQPIPRYRKRLVWRRIK